MEHRDIASQFEKEFLLQKQKENFLKARQILSDKQNTVNALQEKLDAEKADRHIIEMAFQSFILSGDLDAYMKAIKDTNYFGKRS